jgi:hypothetical protein
VGFSNVMKASSLLLPNNDGVEFSDVFDADMATFDLHNNPCYSPHGRMANEALHLRFRLLLSYTLGFSAFEPIGLVPLSERAQCRKEVLWYNG